ncbi:MAG TPA: universal stress protein [Acidimicrobiales bacterium]|nr:universal stress protein [Acidimicrobiales bacterium]
MKLVVGVDETPESAAAVTWAAALAGASASTVTIAEVFEPEEAERPPEHAAELRREAGHRLTSWVERLGLGLPHCAALALEGRPVGSLAALADRSGADALIIGSKPYEGVSRWALGSLAHALVHHVHCPLIVVPNAGADLTGGQLLVCDDDTEGGRVAVQWARNLGGQVGAEVEVVRPDGRDPARQLRALAWETSAGLLVVPARSHHSFDGWLVGALPDALLHHPTCPVAVLPYGYLTRSRDLLRSGSRP